MECFGTAMMSTHIHTVARYEACMCSRDLTHLIRDMCAVIPPTPAAAELDPPPDCCTLLPYFSSLTVSCFIRGSTQVGGNRLIVVLITFTSLVCKVFCNNQIHHCCMMVYSNMEISRGDNSSGISIINSLLTDSCNQCLSILDGKTTTKSFR